MSNAQKRAKDLQYELLSVAKKYSELGVSYKEIVGYFLNISTILSVAADISITDNVKVLEQLYSSIALENDTQKD